MRRTLAFLVLCSVKLISTIFYRCEYVWIKGTQPKDWKEFRLFVLLNHTSLYEPLFVQILPYSYLWFLAGHWNIPGADVTLNRPLVGTFWKLMLPNISSITRKKDKSWETYLKTIRKDDVVMIAPEGRMKRPNGLDKDGKPMTVRGGVADIIESMNSGKILLCLSGGLHHVQRPGEHLPRIFKTIKMNLYAENIADYKQRFSGSPRERKLRIIDDLQNNLETNCPDQR